MTLKIVSYIISLITWLRQTRMRRFWGTFGVIILGACILEFIRWGLWGLGIEIVLTSTFLPKPLAMIFSFMIYYLWAVAIWKIVSFFGSKPEAPTLVSKSTPIRSHGCDMSLN